MEKSVVSLVSCFDLVLKGRLSVVPLICCCRPMLSWACVVLGIFFLEMIIAAGSYYSVVGGRDVGSMGRKGLVKERPLQIVSVTTQVAFSRRVSRFRLQLRGRQESRRSRGGGMTDPHR